MEPETDTLDRSYDPEVFYYRFDDSCYDSKKPVLRRFVVVRKTRCGAWVIPHYTYYRAAHRLEDRSATHLRAEFGAKFVRYNARRRYCYPTVELAKDSYRIRKERQIQHARNAIATAEAMLAWIANPDGQEADTDTFTFGLSDLV